MARRILTEQERQDWAAFTRLIRRLGASAAPAPLAAPAPPPPAPREAAARDVPAPAARPRPPVRVGEAPGGLDASSWNRFRTGKLAPTRTLDLHGRTAPLAYNAVEAFLHSAQADGIRCVEIITGRGTGKSGGILKRELPLWLNGPTLRPLILAANHPHPANPGAVRVLLKRVR